MPKGIKTEHAGAKKGGSGYWGHHAEAKEVCKSKRRLNDKKEVRQGIRLGEDRPQAYLLKQIEDLVAVPFGSDGLAGDSAFVPTDDYDESGSPIPADVKSTLGQLKRHFRDRCKAVGLPLMKVDEPVGFWLLYLKDFETAMFAKVLVDEMIGTREYVVNAIVKCLINRLASRVIGDKSVLKEK